MEEVVPEQTLKEGREGISDKESSTEVGVSLDFGG